MPLQFLAVAGLAIVFLLLVVGFNRLVVMRNLVRNAWSDVDVQLRRRSDLIPALVEVVKGYAGFEQRTLEQLAAARARAEAPDLDPAGRAEAEAALTSQARQIIALAEAYPDVKASAQFRRLQTELAEVENDLAASRRYYNAVVRDYNTLIESFPMSLLAQPTGFARAAFFTAEGPERITPEVDLVP